MSQSLSKIYIHITYGTRFRQNLISRDFAPQLHAYLAAVHKDQDCPALIINSVPDHIHILFRMSKTVSIADLIEHVKKNSSKWVKCQPLGSESFYWQNGYGAFSVSQSQTGRVIKYISRQEEHHKKLTYREEIDGLMKKYKVEGYSPEYYWD